MLEEERLMLDCPSIDVPDNRDWSYGELGLYGAVQEKVEFPDNLKMYNQGRYPACGCYGITHAHNAEQLLEFDEAKQPDPIEERKEYCDERGTDYTSRGSTMQTWLNRFVDNGRITGYAKCESLGDIRRNLDAGNYIYSGSAHGNWGAIKKSGIREERDDGKFVGHLYCFVRYNDEGVYAINSYGEDRGVDNGWFLVKWKDIPKQFSTYALFDKKDAQRIEDFKIYKANKILRKKSDDEEIRKHYQEINDILRKKRGFPFDITAL